MNEKEPIRIRLSTAILIFIILILIFALVVMYFHFTSSGNIANNNVQTNESNSSSDNDSNVEEISKKVSLDIESDEVKQLYSYIMKINTNQEELVYRNTKVTEKDLNNQLKLITVFENIDESKASEVKTTTDAYGYKTEHTYYKKDTIEDMAKKVFGEDVTITHESCEAFFASARDYENGVYDCYDYEGGGGVPWESSTSKLLSAEKVGDEIYIYDKYVHIVEVDNIINGLNYSGTNDIYEASDKKVKLAEKVDFGKNNLYGDDEISNIEKFLNKEVTTFKHTFKKNLDDTYYWYSTEPIEK